MNSAMIYKGLFGFIVAFLAWVFVSTHSVPQTLNVSGDEYNMLGYRSSCLMAGSLGNLSNEVRVYPYFLHLVFLSSSSLSSLPF